MSEHQQQAAVIDWWRWQYRDKRNLLFSIPNGAWLAGDSKRRAIQMQKLKAEGLVVGVPDLFLAIPMQGYAGLFIEMKDKRGKLSPAQREMGESLIEQGYRVVVAFGVDEAREEIRWYMGT